MRVTSNSQSAAMRADLGDVSGRLARIQRQVASGREIERASDGPARALEALRYRRSLRAYEQYDRNLGDAKAWLNTTDTTLDSVDTQLTRAQDLTIQADNGSLSATARSAIATELRAIADEVVSLANTRHLGRPIFSGTAGGDQAYAGDGTFLGDTRAVNRTTGAGSSHQVNAVGPDVFGVQDLTDPANGDVFQVLRDIADKVEAGTQAAGGLDGIDAARSRLNTVRATMGSRLSSIEQLEVRNTGTKIEMRSALSETEDVDLTDAILELKGQEAAYTAALSVTARILDQSLLNFLR